MRVACHLCEGPCKGFCPVFHLRHVCAQQALLALAVYHGGLTWHQSHLQPCLACAVCHNTSCLSLLPDFPPASSPRQQCPGSQGSAPRRSLLATVIMSVWLWSIAVTSDLTAGTCLMSSIAVRSSWEPRGVPGGLPRGRAAFESLGHLGSKGLAQAERSGECGDGERVMAEAGRGVDSREPGGLWGEG